MTKVGSWHVDGHNMAAVIRKTADGWETVARCPNENASWREDARLMAAAPEMLEALREATHILQIVDTGKGDTVARLRAVIAKAEGRK